MPPKIDKASVLYLHKPSTDYECRDCTMFIPATKHCSIHGPQDVIQPYGSCGLFVKGKPGTGMTQPMHPMSQVTKVQSGYVESQEGFSCKRCEYWIKADSDCQKVDRFSQGDDYGVIHEDGCCNSFESADEDKDEDD